MPGTIDFARALIPDRWTIFGQRLLPYTLGHHIAVSRSCPTILTRGATLDDLLIATRICSRPFNPDDPLGALRVSLPWLCRAALIRLTVLRRPAILFERAAMFGEYLSAAMQIPKFWRLASDGPGGSGTPLEVRLLSSLAASGVPLRDALRLPLAAAWWLLLAQSERAGAIQVDDEDIEEIVTPA
jgi:hypothetical protein